MDAIWIARDAAGPKEQIARETGLSATTIRNYETNPGRWMNPVRYLRFLADQTPEGRTAVLGLMGAAESEVRDPQVQELVTMLTEARRMPGWDGVYEAMRRMLAWTPAVEPKPPPDSGEYEPPADATPRRRA